MLRLLPCVLLLATLVFSQNNLREVYRDENTIILFNSVIDRSRTNWIFSLYSKSWAHARRNYGNFQNRDGGRLRGIFQATAGDGGMATGVNPGNLEIYMDVSPGSIRAGNLYDKAGSNGKRPNQELLFNYQVAAISQIIEEANNGMKGSPASGVWGTKGWTYIAIYDIFLHSGLEDDAEDWKKAKFNEASDAATAKNIVYWLRDWWLPIYEKYGKTALLGRFFRLVAQNWPRNGNTYIGTMNVGQFIHFFSGAAQTNLKNHAVRALGWEDEDEESFRKAQQDFPRIRY